MNRLTSEGVGFNSLLKFTQGEMVDTRVHAFSLYTSSINVGCGELLLGGRKFLFEFTNPACLLD